MNKKGVELELKTAEIDGKRVAYTNQTVFRVQIARGRSGYRDRYRVIGNLAQAVALYNGINISAPYRARLYSDHMNKPTLARKAGL